MTDLGASRVHAEVRAVVDGILGSHVGMDELQSKAGAVIARATGAQAGCVAGCSAAAMTQVVAACMTGTDLALIEALPAFPGERRVLVPMGHVVNFGAPVDQAIRLGRRRSHSGGNRRCMRNLAHACSIGKGLLLRHVCCVAPYRVQEGTSLGRVHRSLP